MTDKNSMPDYRETIFLPKTTFPLRSDLPKRETEILARWQKMKLHQRLRQQAQGRKPFMLHDGPPYANGHLHIGHALNKILKDAINRAQTMAGANAHYIPGWDCHGLPIEWMVEEQYRKSGRDTTSNPVPVLEFRAACRAYAQKWLDIQTEEFKRLGVEADYSNRYATMDFASEAKIADEIGKFLLDGTLYRGLRPVMWSVVEKTALAEAEIEYHDRIDDAVFVRFPVLKNAQGADSIADLAGASIVIWTTTPWSLPGNRALAAGPDIAYTVLHVDTVSEGSSARVGERLIVALDLLEKVCAAIGITGHHTGAVFNGATLDGLVCAHPLRNHGYDHDVPVLMGDFVTTEQGTGLVHMAPAHGEDDFALCRSHGIDVPETVGEDGTYNNWVPLFSGLHVFKASDPVCSALTETHGLLHRNKITHSYPHSWRSKAPLIYRATSQWFIQLDGKNQLRHRSLEAIDATDFIPEAGRTRLRSMVAARPDWCISRQRVWGVPIPVFVERRTGEPLRDPAVVARIVETFTQDGADAWYTTPPEHYLGEGRNPIEYEQVFDIVDVWFESGASHAFALEARGLSWPADLYLEGSDQHRGWFQSSLLEAIGTRGAAPFKTLLTHGFVLDEKGRKMSKSQGNTTAPQKVCDTSGADILRLWVMNTDTSEDLRVGPEILKQQTELYRRYRNTLRWILGALDGFCEAERMQYNDMPELEQWILHRLTELDGLIQKAVKTHDWRGVYPAIHAFCANDLSAFYFDVRKDAVYCDRPDSLRRRSARTTLDILHRCLTTWLAPVLVFTAEDVWTARFGEDSSVHLQSFPDLPMEWNNNALANKWDRVRNIRRSITASLEEARRLGTINASLQAKVVLHLDPRETSLLPGETWAELAIVSNVEIKPNTINEAHVSPAPGQKCARCWRILPEVEQNKDAPGLCGRCGDAVKKSLVCHPTT